MTTHSSWAFAFGVVFILYPSLANAWLRAPVADPDVVQRAELVVVGHVEDGSLIYESQPNRMGEYRTSLIITEVIKGHALGHQIPVIIHYGLTPVIGGFVKTNQVMLDVRRNKQDYPKDVIEIFDTGNSARSFDPIADDIRKDHLWFLRVRENKDQGSSGSDGADTLGLWDPEDIQPLELKPYFQAFLTDQLAEHLKRLATGHSLVADRSQNYLVHLDIVKASQEPDLTRRADLLLPFCLYRDDKEDGSTQREALNKMGLDCGKAGAARLVQIFNDPAYEAMQRSIMSIWQETEYHESLPVIVNLLEKENLQWSRVNIAEQGLTTTAQYKSLDLVQEALLVLNRLADPTSKSVIEETQHVWEAPEKRLVGNTVLQTCDAALRSIAEAVDRSEDGADPQKLEERKKSDLEVTTAKQIALACRLYAMDHDGKYPKDLKELFPIYVSYEKNFVSPLSNDPTQPSYQYFGGSEPDPVRKVVLRSLFTTSNGKRTIVYNDGVAERKNDP